MLLFLFFILNFNMSFILILPLDIHSDKSHSFYDKIYFIIFFKDNTIL